MINTLSGFSLFFYFLIIDKILCYLIVIVMNYKSRKYKKVKKVKRILKEVEKEVTKSVLLKKAN